MASCHDMSKGEIWSCPDCGLELQVVKECTECGEEGGCGCEEGSDSCALTCCGKDLVKKS